MAFLSSASNILTARLSSAVKATLTSYARTVAAPNLGTFGLALDNSLSLELTDTQWHDSQLRDPQMSIEMSSIVRPLEDALRSHSPTSMLERP